MRLIIDTDAFYKLAAAKLLEPAIQILGSSIEQVARLPALPHMLRRGRLAKELGELLAAELVNVANNFAALAESEDLRFAELLANVHNIDVGEVQLFSHAAKNEVRLLTGDNRALIAVSKIPVIVPKLNGKIVCFETILDALCVELGGEIVCQKIAPFRRLDKGVFQSCFSEGNQNPRDCLESYLKDLQKNVQPLQLWKMGQS